MGTVVRDPWPPRLKLPPTLKFVAVYAISRRLFKHEIMGGRTERIGHWPSRKRELSRFENSQNIKMRVLVPVTLRCFENSRNIETNFPPAYYADRSRRPGTK
jgi:hypothetical protein